LKLTQRLASGLTIRQDFQNSVRFVMFESIVENETFYATHGGTAFVIGFKGRPFAITCNHIPKDFRWQDICLTDTKFGKEIIGLKSVSFPSKPEDAAVDSDILDVAIIQFSDDASLSNFRDSAYTWDDNTIATSRVGDKLNVYGALKDLSTIENHTIKPVFGLLEFDDAGPYEKDLVLRNGISQFSDVEFENLTGISGSPVFNKTLGKLCGMVLRGNLVDGKASIKYIDIKDIAQVLNGICDGSFEAKYTKEIIRPQ